MATISENLQTLATAKANIKTAIENKGQDLTNVPFTQYGEKIADIKTGVDEISIDLIKGLWMTAEAYDGMYEMLFINDNRTLSYRKATGNSSTSFEIEGFNIIVQENVFATYDTNTGLITITENDVTKAFYKQQEPLMSTVVGTYKNNIIGLSVVLNADGTAKLSMAGQKFDCTFTINGYEIVVNSPENGNVTFEYISMTGQLVFAFEGIQWLDRVTPQDDIEITKNGTYDVLMAKSAVVNVSVGGKNINIQLPSAFESATIIYYADVANDKLLISSNAENCGLWLYDINSAVITQAFAEKAHWRYFQQVTDTKWLISSTETYTGVLLYNSTDNSVTRIWTAGGSGGGANNFYQLTNNIWMLAGNRTLLYNADNDVCVEVYSSGGYWNYRQQVTDTKWLISSTASNIGLVLIDIENNSGTKIYSTGSTWQYFQQVTDTKWLIGSSNTTTGSQGILLYNPTDNSCTQIYTTEYGWQHFQQVTDTKWLISGSVSGSGILLYNTEDDSFIQIYSTNQAWAYYCQVTDTKWLISGNVSDTGVLLYDLTDNSFTQVYTTGYAWQYQQVSETKFLLACSNENGLLLYNAEDGSCTKIYSSYKSLRNYKQVTETKWLISSTTATSGLLLYNAEDDSVTRIYSSGYAWNIFQQVTDTKLLISGTASSSTGLLLYNSADDSLTKIYATGRYYDVFTPDTDNNYYVSSSDKTVCAYTLYYTESTDSAILAKYYVEVV